MLEKGLVQIYTGDGKGKTTAAFGLAFRAAGAGNKVLIYQFLKPASLELSERTAAKKSNLDIEIKTLDIDWDMLKSLKDEQVKQKTALLIKQALAEISQLARNKSYNIIILDEIVYCLSRKLADIEDIKSLLACRDGAVEIVLTGSGATKELIDLADLVSEIKPVKHPFQKGIYARKGIEY